MRAGAIFRLLFELQYSNPYLSYHCRGTVLQGTLRLDKKTKQHEHIGARIIRVLYCSLRLADAAKRRCRQAYRTPRPEQNDQPKAGLASAPRRPVARNRGGLFSSS